MGTHLRSPSLFQEALSIVVNTPNAHIKVGGHACIASFGQKCGGPEVPMVRYLYFPPQHHWVAAECGSERSVATKMKSTGRTSSVSVLAAGFHEVCGH
jgi:hypothetical protein